MLFNPLAGQTTLASRVRNYIIGLTVVLFLFFSSVAVFIVYSLEDAIFIDQLQQTYQKFKQGKSLPEGYQLLEESSAYKPKITEQIKYFEFNTQEASGEFQQHGKHYHYVKVVEGVLLLETTQLGIVSRAIGDILLLLAVALMPALIFTLWFSSKISNRAIQPFTQVHQTISTNDYDVNDVKLALQGIEEQDVKELAMQLVTAIEQKSQMLEEQIVFNQGMAHEIRTPLQVMTHSSELIAHLVDYINELPAYHRLNKSIVRMKRISNALLWLTSTTHERHEIQVSAVIEQTLHESKSLLKTHNINVNCVEQEHLILPMPDVVFELIVLNLLTNVVHHSQVAEGGTCWHIVISASEVCFNNQVEMSDIDKENKGFGLGLMLVRKLTDKFGLTLVIEQKEQEFTVKIRL